MLLGLRGTPVLYQGDEIGLGDTTLEQQDLRDPLGVRYWPAYAGRDAMRTPMHWRNAPGGGFTDAGVRPWLPLGDTAVQRRGPARGPRLDPPAHPGPPRRCGRRHPICASARTRSCPRRRACGRGAAASGHAIAINCSERDVGLEGLGGRVLIGTDRSRDAGTVVGPVLLRAWEGLVVEVAKPE